MTSTSYSRANYLPSLPRNALFEIRPPRPWPAKFDLPDIIDLETFKIVHLWVDDKIKDYIEYPRRNYGHQPSTDIPSQLRRDAAFELWANNAYARIFFLHVAMKQIAARQLFKAGPVFHVTMTPPQFTFELEDRRFFKRPRWVSAKKRVASDAARFDIRRIQALTRYALKGISFVGMTEAALQKQLPSKDVPFQTDLVSWHTHNLCFGTCKSQVEAALEPLRCNYNRKRSEADPNIVHVKHSKARQTCSAP